MKVFVRIFRLPFFLVGLLFLTVTEFVFLVFTMLLDILYLLGLNDHSATSVNIKWYTEVVKGMYDWLTLPHGFPADGL